MLRRTEGGPAPSLKHSDGDVEGVWREENTDGRSGDEDASELKTLEKAVAAEGWEIVMATEDPWCGDRFPACLVPQKSQWAMPHLPVSFPGPLFLLISYPLIPLWNKAFKSFWFLGFGWYKTVDAPGELPRVPLATSTPCHCPHLLAPGCFLTMVSPAALLGRFSWHQWPVIGWGWSRRGPLPRLKQS